jgi:group I intron endonuclease
MPLIYLITCLPTGRYYVGKTVCYLEVRWRNHKTVAKRKKLKGPLQNSLSKYGAENHVIEVLTECQSEYLNYMERLWIAVLNAQDREIGLNLTGGGDGQLNLTLDQRDAISQRMKGNKHGEGKNLSPERRAAISARRKGKPTIPPGTKLPQEWCDNIGQSRKGKILSEEANRRTHAWWNTPKGEVQKLRLAQHAKAASDARWGKGSQNVAIF